MHGSDQVEGGTCTTCPSRVVQGHAPLGLLELEVYHLADTLEGVILMVVAYFVKAMSVCIISIYHTTFKIPRWAKLEPRCGRCPTFPAAPKGAMHTHTPPPPHTHTPTPTHLHMHNYCADYCVQAVKNFSNIDFRNE